MKTLIHLKKTACGSYCGAPGVGALAALLIMFALPTLAQNFKLLHTFGTNAMGVAPFAELVQGPDGRLYGTTEWGGPANNGQVFSVNPDGSGYTVLKDFTGKDGFGPEGGLVLLGNTLYGTTRLGGTNDCGVVFRLNTDGTQFAVLKRFNGLDGASPAGTLCLSGTNLFGTTIYGGFNEYGVVFRLNTDGSGYTVLRYFTDQTGSNPYDGLLLHDGTLYGTTSSGGGANCSGTVFSLGLDGRNLHVLRRFTGSDGGSPTARLANSGPVLYGTTTTGTIFKINTDGTGFAVLHSLADPPEGIYCYAGVLISGTTLYGTARAGGEAGCGTVFQLNTDGTGFTVLRAFTNTPDGAGPYGGGLLLCGNTLYGTTHDGGLAGDGTLFKLQTDGSGYTTILHFPGGDGAYGNGRLLISGATCYGASPAGGAAGKGTIFRINTDGSDYTILKNFTNSLEGVTPNAALVLAGTALYGTTQSGGSNGVGAVFRMNLDGSQFSVLHSFAPVDWGGFLLTNADGWGPNGQLVLNGSTLYGATYRGGPNDSGTIFKVNLDGSGFATLYSFSALINYVGMPESTNTDGAHPSVLLSGSTLYGTTSAGGSKGFGTVFKVGLDGTGFSVLHDFAGAPADGSSPAELTVSDAILYGTTAGGGQN